MSAITIYTSSTCPHCQSAKKYFLSKGYKFDDKNVQENREYRKELLDKGYRGVPIIIIDEVEIVGFDKEKIDQLLKV
jgi:glutaredoxin-like YruB-family protein